MLAAHHYLTIGVNVRDVCHVTSSGFILVHVLCIITQ